jgi:PAS domain S-box-containing protein
MSQHLPRITTDSRVTERSIADRFASEAAAPSRQADDSASSASADSLAEAYWEQAVDAAILLFDAAGAIVRANAGARQLFEPAFGSLDNLTWEGFCSACGLRAEAPPLETPAAAPCGTVGYAAEVGIVGFDGAEVRVALAVSPLAESDGRVAGHALTAHDVTARFNSETALWQIVEHSLNAIVFVNRLGNIVSVNAQTERMFGYPRSRLIGLPVETLVPERFRAEHPRNRDAFFNRPVVRPMGAGRDLFGRRSDGSEFPVEIGLSPVQTSDGPGVLASIVDITERKRGERRFRLAVESAPDAMVMINREGRIVLVNLQTEKLFGYSREELLGELVEILVPERYRDRHPAYRESFLASPSVRAMGAGRELFGRRKDGSEFPIEIGLNPIETGDETLVLSAIVDITARKEAEARARKHLADLAHVARLSTVGQMFSELAHEINQPLAAAANYARACVTFAKTGGGVVTQEQMIQWMERAATQTARAVDIVKRLGSFVKKDGGVRSAVDINHLVEQVVGLSIPAMQTTADGAPPLELKLDLDPATPAIFVDRVQIEQVLLNLVRNAVEAMQERRSRPSRLTLRSRFDKTCVTISVADTGPGIAPENLARVFEPYFTTKSSGIGLGLSISRSIAEDHGGGLVVESSSSGSTFRVTLPINHHGNLT